VDTVRTDDGVELCYEMAGEGPTVAFVPTVGFGAWQWAWQHEALTGPYQTVVFDLRGTGSSDRPVGPYELDRLVADLDAVLADANARRVHLVGLGFGSLLALEYAQQFGRARSLALVGTPEGAVDSTASRVSTAVATAPDDTGQLRDSLSVLLSRSFRDAQPDVLDGIAEWRADDATIDGWQAQLAAFEQYARSWPLYEVTIDTLVCHGAADELVDPACSARLTRDLPSAEHVTFEDAGHLVTVERSRPLNDRLLGHLETVLEE
jgi:pimeloyl-ACP methyl ester carboxylesterase